MKPGKKYRLIVFKIIKRKTLKSKTLDWTSKRRLSNSVKGRYNKIQTKQIKHFNEQSVNQIKKTNMHYKWLSFKTTAIHHIFIFIIEFPCQDFIIRFTIWNILQKTVEKAIFYNKIKLSGKQQHIFYVNLLHSTDTKADVAWNLGMSIFNHTLL